MNRLNAITLAITATFSAATLANLPQNHNITGNATVTTDNNKMTITQTDEQIKIDWESFNIGQNNTVEFKQPNTTSIAYNRVTGGNASQIQGKLEANGRVFLANPNGVIFGKDSQVNVGALLATTKVLTTENLNATELNFARDQNKTGVSGKITNSGMITATGKNGFVVLVGDEVENNGKINAKHYEKTEIVKEKICIQGCDEWSGWWTPKKYREEEKEKKILTQAQAILASGENFDLELTDSDISVSVNANTLASIIRNNGAIIAENGYIELTAKGQNSVLENAVNNNGLLEATEMDSLNSSGKIILHAKRTHLGEKSRILAPVELEIAEDTRLKSKNIILSSDKGSKITSKKTVIQANEKLTFTGEFDREEFVSDGVRMYDAGNGKQTNELELKIKGNLTISDNDENIEGNFVSSSAFSSMLNSYGKVSLNINNITINNDLNLNSYKKSDSYLKLSDFYTLKINSNINSPNNRLNILVSPNFSTTEKSIHINNASLDLGGGSFVASIKGRYYVGDRKTSYSEDEARDPFSVSLKNVTLKNIGDFVIGGGINTVDLDNVNHDGKMNLYIHGGSTRKAYRNESVWEYGFKDLDKRVDRTEKNHPNNRWKYDTETASLGLNREFHDSFDSWHIEKNPRGHLETTINIKNSNIKTNDGFIHLMAKNVNLTNSSFDVSFDRDISKDSYATSINKFGLNAQNAVLDNSHIKVVGAERMGVSPLGTNGVAGVFVIGDLLGKNKSSIFAKTHQGFTFRTAKGTTLRGEKSQEDLKITAINTGSRPGEEIGIQSSDNDANLANFALSLIRQGGKGAETTIQNATVTAIAPNGAEAYMTHPDAANYASLNVQNSKFTYFEQPRVKNIGLTKIHGNSQITKLSERNMLRTLDSTQGIVATTLSATQSRLPENHKSMTEEKPSIEMTAEKTVTIEVCDKPNNCTLQSIGDRHSASKVVVGEIM